MESKVRIILGILLVSFAANQVECATLTHHFRSVRDVELPPSLKIPVTNSTKKDVVTSTTPSVTQSSLTSTVDKPSLQITQDKISADNSTVDKNVNKVEYKTDDLVKNESVKTSVEETLPVPKEKSTISRGIVKFQTSESPNKETETKDSKEKTNLNKNEEPKATGRSLNIDIDKYVSPEFHNKNNVYSLPTSPEIEKYLEPGSEDFSDEVTKPSLPKKLFTTRTTSNEFNFDLTTPQSNIFDNKFQMLVDGIKQNLDEFNTNTDQFKHDDKGKSNLDNDTATNYDISKLIDNYNNADNETDVSLETKEYKNIDLKTDKNKGNKDVESGKSVNYESTNLKSRTFGENQENSDVPAINKLPSNKEIDNSADNEKHETKTVETSQTKKVTDSTESQQSVTTLKPTSTTFIPSKKPRFQISLRNNTIETTAPDSEIKPKSMKHFSYESSSLDPLYDTEKITYTKPIYENAINISKRGSTKFVGTTQELNTSTTPNFMNYDNKNFTIPPTATAWTLVTLKDVPPSNTSTTESNITDNSNEQNSQENNLVKIQVSPPIIKETTTDIPSSTENDLSSTTKYYSVSSSSRSYYSTTSNEDLTDTYDEITTSTEDTTSFEDSTEQQSRTTESITSTTSNEFSTTEYPKFSSQNYETTSEQTEESTENNSNTENISKYITTTDSTTTTDSITTESTTTEMDLTTKTYNLQDSSVTSTIEPDTTQRTETESEETTTNFNENYETVTFNIRPSSKSTATTNGIKLISPKTESENELYTTLKTISDNQSNSTNPVINKSEIESTTQRKTTEKSVATTKFQKMSSTLATNLEPNEEDIDNNFEGDNDYSDIIKKEKNATDVNDPDIEIVPIDNTEQGSRTTWRPKNIDVSTKKLNETTTSIFKDQKSILVNGNETENSTADTMSSTDMLSHDEAPEDSNSGMIAVIAISSVGGVCLILLAGLLLIMRKRQKRVTYGQRCRPVSLDAYSLDNVSVYNSVRRKGALRASKRSYGNPAFDDPVSISHQMNFQSLVKFAENVEGMSGEFDEIPQVTARANEVPAGCETKNRYANVIPLPETRVFLKASDNDPHSDYINANYVTGPKNTRGYYIACQAPMQNTVDDFWRMIWEQQCRVVLMLTNLYENGIEKCADYLPPSEVLDCHRLFGDFQITLKKREVKEKYIISSLQLKNMVSNSWREVTHLWYLGWPERGVPTETNSLIAFLIEARSHLKTASNNNSSNDKTSESSNIYISNAAGSGGNGPDGGPMVVHCSPGTGRTGTAIACDIAIRDFELTRAVDVPKIVYRVRRDRASAVQTRDQYAFIYKVISVYSTKLTGGALDSI